MLSTRFRTVVFAVLLSLGFVKVASAYYNPRTGRFLSRDPIGEPGAVMLRRAGGGFLPQDAVAQHLALASGFLPRDPVTHQNPTVRRQPDGLFIPRDRLGGAGPHRYCYVQNEPTNAVDPYGLDRYAAYEGLHAWIAVDEWECKDCKWQKTGKILRFDFSVDWSAWGGWGWPLGVLGFKGKVVPSTVTNTSDVDRTQKSSACQDIVLLRFLNSAVSYTPGYSLVMYNCHDFVAEHMPIGMNRTTPECCGPKSCPPLPSDHESKGVVIPEAF